MHILSLLAPDDNPTILPPSLTISFSNSSTYELLNTVLFA